MFSTQAKTNLNEYAGLHIISESLSTPEVSRSAKLESPVDLILLVYKITTFGCVPCSSAQAENIKTDTHLRLNRLSSWVCFLT